MSCVCYNSMLVHGRLQTRQLFQVIILRPIKKGDVQEKTWKVRFDVDRYIKLLSTVLIKSKDIWLFQSFFD